MSTKRTMVKTELVPYLNLFDLNKEWAELRIQKTEFVEELSQMRSRGWILSHKITEIEEKISQAIQKLEKKQ